VKGKYAGRHRKPKSPGIHPRIITVITPPADNVILITPDSQDTGPLAPVPEQ